MIFFLVPYGLKNMMPVILLKEIIIIMHTTGSNSFFSFLYISEKADLFNFTSDKYEPAIVILPPCFFY